MRLVIASDIHGSALWCGALLDAFGRENAERLLLLGDILYHGPRNDLPEGYAPREVAALLNACSFPILGVRGNCDAEIDQTVLEFPMMAEYCLLSAGTRTIFATHGHIFNTASPPPLRRGDMWKVHFARSRMIADELTPNTLCWTIDGARHGVPGEWRSLKIGKPSLTKQHE